VELRLIDESRHCNDPKTERMPGLDQPSNHGNRAIGASANPTFFQEGGTLLQVCALRQTDKSVDTR
jgi:hypothetical protein